MLFIVSDQHRHDYLGSRGHPTVKTPNLDRLAASGVSLDNTYCQQPLCGPSRGCMLTGTYSHSCSMWTNGGESVLPEVPTMGSLFRGAGFRTAAFGKVHVQGEERGGRDLGFDQRALRYYTYQYQDYIDAVGVENVNRYAPHRPGAPLNKPGYRGRHNYENTPSFCDEDLMYDNLVTDQVIGFLHEEREKPFLLWCGLEKPHPEWSAPARFHEMYDPQAMKVPATFRESRDDLPGIMRRRFTPQNDRHGSFYDAKVLSKEQEDELVRNSLAAYHATISYLDWNIGRILDQLEGSGLRENTLVIYTSDHGDHTFEHGLIQKHSFYEGDTRVPLIFSNPSLPQGERREHITNVIDVLPTVLEYADVEVPGSLEGESRISLLHGDDAFEGVGISDFYSFGIPERMIRAPRWKYMLSDAPVEAGGGDQLYDLDADPHETTNLASDPAHGSTREELRATLLASWADAPKRWREISASKGSSS
jgi:arylsulfatase A-like enzyme